MLLVLFRLVLLCVLTVVFSFFFFKQKTAYEMRISDWSSDVCSSDLLRRVDDRGRHQRAEHAAVGKSEGAALHLLHLERAVFGALAEIADRALDKIGRASCRERVCQYG